MTYCAACNTPLPNFDPEEAVKEFKEVFGYPPKETDLNPVCDDCYEQAMQMMRRDMANQ